MSAQETPNKAGEQDSPAILTNPLTEEVNKHKAEAEVEGEKLHEQARLLAEMAQVEARERHNAVIQKQIQELKLAMERAKEASPVANKVLIQEDPDTAKLLEALNLLKGEEVSRQDVQ